MDAGMLEALKLRAGGDVSDELAAYLLAETEEVICNYCNISEMPAGLRHTAVAMAADMVREQRGGPVASVKEGDSQVTYGTAPKDVIGNYRAQLNRYRRIGTVYDGGSWKAAAGQHDGGTHTD